MKHEQRGEIEKGRPHHGLVRFEYAGRHHGGDRVRRIMKAVHEIENQRNRNQQHDDAQADA